MTRGKLSSYFGATKGSAPDMSVGTERQDLGNICLQSVLLGIAMAQPVYTSTPQLALLLRDQEIAGCESSKHHQLGAETSCHGAQRVCMMQKQVEKETLLSP